MAAVLLLALALAAAPSWQPEPPLPTARAEVAATALRGEVVVAGGYLADGSSSTTVEAYSAARRSWRALPPLPRAVNHPMAAAAEGRLYLLGGYGSDGAPSRSALVLGSRGWTALPSMPHSRAAAGAAIVGGRLYVVGGVTADAGGGRALARSMLVLDLARLRWSAVAGPTPREHLGVASLRGRIYALAGRRAGLDTNLRTFEEYAPGRGWLPLPPVPAARGGTAAATLGRSIVSAGGEAPDGTISSVYAYDVDRWRWRRLPDLGTARHGLGLVATGGRVYAVAGGTTPGLSTSPVSESLALG